MQLVSDRAGIQLSNCKAIFFLFYQAGYYRQKYHSKTIINRILATRISIILAQPALTTSSSLHDILFL